MPREQPKDDPDWSQFQNPKLRDFFRKGLEQIRSTGKAFTTKPGDPNFEAWLDYFDRHIGERPMVLRMAIADRKGKRSFTVPTEWPHWFDLRASDHDR